MIMDLVDLAELVDAEVVKVVVEYKYIT